MAFIKAHGAGIRTYVPRGGEWHKEVVAYCGRIHRYAGPTIFSQFSA